MGKSKDVNGPKAVFSAVLLGTLGVLSFIVQPALVQGFVTHLGMSEPDAVNLAGIEMLGVAIASILLAVPRMARLDWRILLVIAVLVAAVGNLLSFAAVDTDFLWLARLITGLGSGAIISLSFTFIGLTSRVDRNLCWYLVVLLSYGAIGVWIMPSLLDIVGMGGVFLGFAALSALGLLTVKHVPHGSDSRPEPDPAARNLSTWLIASALGAVLIYNLAQGIAWAILFLIGVNAGIGEQAVADALFASQIAAILGPLLTVWQGARLSRFVSLTVGILAGAGCIALFLGKPSYALFFAGVCGFNLLWNYVTLFLIAAVGEYDTKGRMIGRAIAMQMIGLGGGPLLAAQLIDADPSYWLVEIVCIGCFLVSYALLVPPMMRHRALLNA